MFRVGIAWLAHFSRCLIEVCDKPTSVRQSCTGGVNVAHVSLSLVHWLCLISYRRWQRIVSSFGERAMSPVLPWAILLVVLLAAGVSAGCGRPDAPVEPESERIAADESELPMVNRIAYIDNSGDLLLVNPDSTGEERLTGSVSAGLLSQTLERGDSYSWPTWSPDGTRVAASRVSLGNEGPGLSVQLFDVSTGRMVTVYDNELQAPVADGTPHYLYWAPDSRHLSFLAPTPEGLTLFVKDIQSDEEPGAVAVGTPLYYHWRKDSTLLAVHSGDRVVIQEPTPEGSESRVAVDAIAFRAPALSPDGAEVAYAGIGGGLRGVFLAPTEPSGPPPRLLMETDGLTAFAWAPDGSSLAIAEQLRRNVPVFDRLSMVSADGTESTVLVEEQLVAFYWSPQGDQIAWIGINPLNQTMDLAVSPVEGGKLAGDARRLYSFAPTGEMFGMLSFFDQYAYSHSIWAPDGSALVVTGTDGADSGRRNGSGPHGGQVYVVDVSTGDPRRIASGKLAVWSWN